MRPVPANGSTPRRAHCVVVLLGLGLIAAGVYCLTRTPAPAPPAAAVVADRPGPDELDGIGPAPDNATTGTATKDVADDPVRYASETAARLYGWDTTAEATPEEYVEDVLARSSHGDVDTLTADFTTHLPPETAWGQLAAYDTRQQLRIVDAFVPGAWREITNGPAAHQIPTGTVAVTIDGTARRDGIWNDEPVSTEHPVAFTIFLACRADEPCRVLRLSAPDTPLR